MNSKLLSEIRTRTEADQLIEEIELLKNSLYEDGERSFGSTLNSKVRYWVAEIIKEEVKNINIEEYLENLTQMIKQMEEFKLTLAFEPSNSGINMFVNYLREQLTGSLVLEIEHDPNILGGTIISYQGKYHDFSLVKIFDHEFEEKRDQFLGMIEDKISDSPDQADSRPG